MVHASSFTSVPRIRIAPDLLHHHMANDCTSIWLLHVPQRQNIPPRHYSTLLLGTSIGWKNIQAAAFETTGRDASLSGRDALWSIVFNEGKQHPVFGKGYGAFWTEGKGRELVQTWNPRQSHNAYLDVWLDLGILGLIGVGLCFHVALFTHWSRVRGDIGSPRRRAMAALYAAAFGYMLSYAFAQSFLLRFDSFPFLVLTWSTLLITNRDHNGINQEFPILS
jgi:O-antigen ligase